MATTTVTLRPTGAIDFSALTSGTVVGPAPQLADDSDASYVTVGGAGGVFESATTGLSGDTVSITFHLRASVTGGPFEVFLQARLQAAGFTIASFTIPNDGIVYDLTAEAGMEDTPPDWLAVAPFFSVGVTLPNDGQVLTIYKLWAVVTVVDEEVRVTRQFPRDDAYGLGSAPRIFPSPKSRRLIGGYQ